MGYMSSGNAEVDRMGSFSIKGNIIAPEWYKTIIRENGKPYLLAISLLADIVYWYRPNEVRDQQSGNVVGWQKRFSGDLLQKSYEQYADYYGESKRSIKTAIDHLVKLGVIERIFRDIRMKNGQKLYNVMYISLNVDRLDEITHAKTPGLTEEHMKQKRAEDEIAEIIHEHTGMSDEICTEDAGGGTKFCRRSDKTMQEVVQNNAAPSTSSCDTLLQNNVTPPTRDCGTNTKTTTENTYREHNNPILSSDRALKITAAPELARQMGIMTDTMDGMDKTDELTEDARRYRELVYDNTDYYWHMENDSHSQREMYKNLVELICDVVCAKNSKPIRINRAEYPAEIVKSRLLKLESTHIEYVIDKLSENPNFRGIDNERAYMLTCLFNAPITIDTHYQQMVNHDMYGGGWEEKGIIPKRE